MDNSRGRVLPAKIAREAFFETNNESDGRPLLQIHVAFWIHTTQ